MKSFTEWSLEAKTLLIMGVDLSRQVRKEGYLCRCEAICHLFKGASECASVVLRDL